MSAPADTNKPPALGSDLRKALTLGLFLFPIKRSAKSPPLVKNWEAKASNDPEQVRHWMQEFPGCNWGIAPGRSGHCVVDEDRPGAFAELDMLYGPIPETFTTRTHSGKLHRWYVGVTKSATKPFSGIGLDIKSRGGYVISPGSVVEGRRYRWEEDRRFAALPTPLLEALKPSEHTREPRKETPACEIDTDLAIHLATRYLKNDAEPSIDGVTEGLVYRTACRVRDLGVSQDVCEQLMMEHWNPRCEPPWEGEEIENHFLVRIANAYRYAQNQAGCASPAADFEPIPEAPKPPPKPISALLDLTTLNDDPPPREWLVEDWIPRGEITSLYGAGGFGKTLLALQLAYSAAYGTEWLGLPTTPAAVLLLLSEDDKNEVHRRVARYRRALGEITPPEGHAPWIRAYAVPSRDYTLVQFDRNGNPQRTPFYDQVEAWIKGMPPGPRLLVADPLTSVFGGNENDRAQASGFIRVDLRRWCRLHGLTQMLLAHPSRAGVSTGDMLSGSTAWENSVRTRLVLMQHKEIPGARKLVRIKSNYSLAGESLTLDYADGVFHAREDAAMFAGLLATHGDQVVEMLRRGVAEGNPFGDARNARRPVWGCLTNGGGRPLTRTALQRILDGLIAVGRVERVTGRSRGNGLYPCENAARILRESREIDELMGVNVDEVLG